MPELPASEGELDDLPIFACIGNLSLSLALLYTIMHPQYKHHADGDMDLSHPWG